MRPSVFPRWRRRIFVCACVLALVVLLGPLVVSEVHHVATRGHFGLGLHTDVMSYRTSSGGTYYSLWAVNLTPFPVPVRVCEEGTDTGLEIRYRYRLEYRTNGAIKVWRSMPLWCDDLGRLRWKVWWPGASTRLVPDDYFLGRYVAFTLYDRSDDDWLQLRIVADETEAAGTTDAR